MSDDRVFDALRQLLLAAPVIRKNVFIVGGTALWDWWYAIIPSVRHSGGDLEEPRFTKDIDLGVERKTVQVAGHPEALRKALEDNGWRQQQEGSFIWENPAWGEITVELLAYTDVGDNPGSPIWIRDSSNAKIVKACATLRRLDPTHGLLEPCRYPGIAEFQVCRFTQIGLLLSKAIAIVSVLDEYREAKRENRDPKKFCERLGKDRFDALLLLRVQEPVRLGITGLQASEAMRQHRKSIEHEIADICQLQRSIPELVPDGEHDGLRELSYAFEQWLMEVTPES